MKTLIRTIDNPFDFPRALAESASGTVIVIHGECRLILDSGRVLSCSGSPEVDVEPVRDIPTGRYNDDPLSPTFMEANAADVFNDLPTADDLAVLGVRELAEDST